jgi:hypothetical protein
MYTDIYVMSRKIVFIYEGKRYTPDEFEILIKSIKTTENERIVYYGSMLCQAKLKSGKNKDEKCTNRAYYRENFKYLCGQHSDKTKRVTLPKNKARAENRNKEIEQHTEEVESIAKDNLSKGIIGKVKCYKMQMMKRVPLIYGYLNVFPNNKHDNRKDGFGCGNLSPMRLGPVIHKQPNLPKAKNIENYHQFSKCWPNEVNKNNDPTEEWRKRRLEGYNDPIPHRHKFDAKEMKKLRADVNGENRNAPLFSVFLDTKGDERKFTYVQCRYFYCKAYEILAKRTGEYKKLLQMITSGKNIMICGYDAYDVTKDLYEHYIDPTNPFGHELVLYSLLTITPSGESEYPWDKYRKENSKLYKNMCHM